MLLSPQAYQSFARECLQWAEQTTDPITRAAFLSLARDWTLAASAQSQIVQSAETDTSCWTGVSIPLRTGLCIT